MKLWQYRQASGGTRMTLEEQIAVMQHAANGGVVEYEAAMGWKVFPRGMPFNWAEFDYRIKKEPREVYQVVRGNGEFSGLPRTDKTRVENDVAHYNEYPDSYKYGPYSYITYREVL